ncbi:uncharacterized protein UHOD_01409 [Ustilago sp. UG-2017b]|nr:uncharacterized protein UHOD_01409 [Ustilago sp. UG-2017b]
MAGLALKNDQSMDADVNSWMRRWRKKQWTRALDAPSADLRRVQLDLPTVKLMIIIAIDTCDQRHFCRTSFNNSRGHSYTEAAQEEDDYDERDAHRYEAADDYYSTPFSSPLKRPVDMSQSPNYETQVAAPVSEGYYAPPQRPIASPFAAVPDQHTTYAPMPRGAGYSSGGYILSPPPRRHY